MIKGIWTREDTAMDNVEIVFLVAGCAANLSLICMLYWSIRRPDRRLWPPERSTPAHKAMVWALTTTGFASAIALGLLGWGTLETPRLLRWGIGPLLIILGNVVVWAGVAQLGFAATSGEEDTLRMNGLYQYSRNPQYVADVAILVGIGLLSATSLSWPVVLSGILALVLAPFAEEPWLEKRYGEAFKKYSTSTRRFL